MKVYIIKIYNVNKSYTTYVASAGYSSRTTRNIEWLRVFASSVAADDWLRNNQISIAGRQYEIVQLTDGSQSITNEDYEPKEERRLDFDSFSAFDDQWHYYHYEEN